MKWSIAVTLHSHMRTLRALSHRRDEIAVLLVAVVGVLTQLFLFTLRTPRQLIITTPPNTIWSSIKQKQTQNVALR